MNGQSLFLWKNKSAEINAQSMVNVKGKNVGANFFKSSPIFGY